MRVTNNMIMSSSKTNINGNKSNISTINNQMTTQKKISKPSEDPVVAIRSLRLRSTLSEINQYYEKNIPDAESWLDVTETALTNMKDILTDIHTQCVKATTGTLTADDRNTILKQLTALKEQVYAEGDSDYAGRTVFTGYKTNTTLTFSTDQADTSYNIDQTLQSSELEEASYTYGTNNIPTAAQIAAGTAPADPKTATVQRMRLAYDQLDINSNADFTVSFSHIDTAAGETQPVVNYKTTAELEAEGYVIPAGEAVLNKDTGELLLSNDLASTINSTGASVSINYNKTGFQAGELKPENYFDCTNKTDPDNLIEYTNFDENGNFVEQNINYTIAANQTIDINTQARDVFDSSIGRDVDELITSVQAAITAHSNVTEIEAMLKEEQFADATSQANLNEWLETAKKQADYADADLQKKYSAGLTNFSGYMSDVNLALTDVGSKGDRLEITKTRMSNQQETVENLKSTNEDRELSDIILDYTAAYTAYQASLQAASKVEKQTLLDYL